MSNKSMQLNRSFYDSLRQATAHIQQTLEAFQLSYMKPLTLAEWLPVAPKVDSWETRVEQPTAHDWIRFTFLGRPSRAGSVTHRLLGAGAEIAPRLDCTKCGEPIDAVEVNVYRALLPNLQRPAYCCRCFLGVLRTMDTEGKQCDG